MRNPDNVLNSLREHSAQPDYTFDRLYRNLYNPDFLFAAYQNIYAAKGNMTAGVDGQTIDAMSQERIARLIEQLKGGAIPPLSSKANLYTQEKRKAPSARSPVNRRQAGTGSRRNDTGSNL